MNLCKKFILVVVAVFAIASQSECLENLSSRRRSETRIPEIDTTNDASINVAHSAHETVLNEARRSSDIGASITALQILVEGYNTAFDLLEIVWRKLHEALERSLKLTSSDPEAAAAAIVKPAQTIVDLIFIKAVPVQSVQGAALSIVGERARPGLRKAFGQLQHAGGILLGTITNAKTMAFLGITSGGKAAEAAVHAAHEVIRSGSSGVYKHVVLSAKKAFHALVVASKKTTKQILKLRTLEAEVVAKVPEVKSALHEFKILYEYALKDVKQESEIMALNEIYYGLISSSIDNAHAVVKAYQTLEDAEHRANQNIEEAINVLENGIYDVRNIVLDVTADSVLGLGAAGQILGPKVDKALAPALVSVVTGRVVLFDELPIAERVATIGIRAGGIACTQGFSAARKIISAGSRALFLHYIKGGKLAFDAIISP